MRSSRLVGFVSAVLCASAFSPMASAKQRAQGSSGVQGSTAAQGSPAVASPLRVNEQYTFPLQSSCRYDARVRGTLTPEDNSGNYGEQRFVPDLAVAAQVSCPNSAALQVSEVQLPRDPVVRTQLDQLLDRIASVPGHESGRRCAYVPNFQLRGDILGAYGVAYRCGMPSAAQGGGPTSAPQGSANNLSLDEGGGVPSDATHGHGWSNGQPFQR